MNVGNVRRLIERLERVEEDEFDMSYWFSSRSSESDGVLSHSIPLLHQILTACGTAACLAGHANIARRALCWWGYAHERRWLGLDRESAERLFLPWRTVPLPGADSHLSDPRRIRRRFTRQQALRTLRHMTAEYAAGRGVVVDWGGGVGASQPAEV